MSYTQFGEISLTTEMMTAAEVNSAIATAQTGAYDLKGSETVANLNTLSAGTTLVKGATYNVSDGGTLNKLESASTSGTVLAGDNVFWTGTYWDKLAGTLNLSGYVQTTRKVNGHALNADVTVTASDIGVESGAQVNTVEGVKLAGASSALTPSSKIVTIPNAVATGSTGATNGLMTADDKKKLSDLPSNANHGFASVTGYNGTTQGDTATGSSLFILGSGNLYVAVDQVATDQAAVTLSVPDASTSGKGAVQLSNSTSDTSTSKAATASAVKAAKDAADAVGTRVSAIETAAGTLYTALAGLDATSMTSANAIKTLVSSLLSYFKAFAAASDNDNSTSYSAS